jgi:hypothetical protein
MISVLDSHASSGPPGYDKSHSSHQERKETKGFFGELAGSTGIYGNRGRYQAAGGGPIGLIGP